MGRVDDVSRVVGALLCGGHAEARSEAAEAQDRDAWLALVAFWFGGTDETLEHAGRALAAAEDPLGRALALATVGLARARNRDQVLTDPFDELEQVLRGHDQRDPAWWFTRTLAAEAALTCAQVDRALALLPDSQVPSPWEGTAVEVLQRQLRVRALAFGGRIDHARHEVDALAAVATTHDLARLAAGLRALVLGNAEPAGADATHALVADVAASPVRDDHVGRGSLLLAAFGAVATGDVLSAATLVLRAGGDASLSALTVVDQALGLELLVAVGELDGDQEAVRAWASLAAPLAAHPAAASTVLRIQARDAALLGNAGAAVLLAEQAVEAAEAAGRAVEAAEGRVVLARSHLLARQVKEATRTLREAVSVADPGGHAAVRRSASQVLSTAGRRLPPVSAGGWSVLSPRERDVADLVLRGLDQHAIAQSLFLSPGTVRSHVSRILCAFGVGTRVGLLSAVGPRGDDPGRDPDDLTPRQRDVVGLLAQGRSNVEVAAALEISVKAVEKHVSDALVRWDAASRFELARQWLRAEAAVPATPAATEPSPAGA
ncbi:LuxR C-terminal-related transcriptional regulator [Aeromicrobium sp.]|uniref:LuxR C-terminal-related transcriptional regulator n=1 Tax=Aeromicrobium sp. TaxID=1871063 RepID=UPI0040349869